MKWLLLNINTCNDFFCILTFDPAKHAIPKTAEVHIPLAWASLADKMGQGTVIDWCTGREWPLNCMTVISAWWRSNMPFQRLSGRWNYYITRWRQEVSEFLEIRSLRQVVVEKASTQQKARPPSLRLSSPRERERHNADGHKSGGSRGVVFIVIGNGHGGTSSNPGWIQLFSLQLWVNSRTDWVLQRWWGNYSRRRKTLNSNLLNSA